MFDTPIPARDMPDKDYYPAEYEDCGESLISLQSLGVICDPYYYKCGIKGAIDDCLVRESVADRLSVVIGKLLPSRCTLRVWDGYRPFPVQQHLWEEYRLIVERENPEFNSSDVDMLTSMFVDKPSVNIEDPFLHNTGGAVDLTICYRDGSDLDFGGYFDDFTPTSYTHYYEPFHGMSDGLNNTAIYNRRLLYNAMTSVGFTNYPVEWWHFDYGNKNWAYYTGQKPIYKGILEA